ncbi:nitroreductase family protein [Amantichitinum ursilacus]|uniref:Nitroreductase family protein n=1 Tax=Amantichitinum ursilacus TaxID=857265 RepID=A0A0N0GP47_9NEIS|nr:nitroreductase family protein [Amantichitinum ursilacus]KPC53423.1 Nitroreductase family protein [Amantichitinum ursilacus]
MLALKTAFWGTIERPSSLRLAWRQLKGARATWQNFFYDFNRYRKHSATYHLNSAETLRSRIIASYHNIEKGLSLPNPRLGFGAENIGYLLSYLNEYLSRYGVDEFLSVPASVLRAYVNFNESNGKLDYPHKDAIKKFIAAVGDKFPDPQGGTIKVTREEIEAVTAGVTADFFNKRFSVRQFSKREVDRADIDAAIAIALKAPAVCNRQNGHVHVAESPELVAKLLEMQGGARGFGQGVNRLLIVTNRLTNFWGMAERNQAWIDGGLFAMSLLYGLHSRNLGACCLNWSKMVDTDRKMHEFLGLPDSEVIIMFIAVGHLPDALEVARSYRKPVSEARSYITRSVN